MIFVTIGTSEPFDRLLAAVDALDTDEEVVAQVGASTLHPASATCHEFLSFDETLAYMREARVVVAHAGVGTVLSALRVGQTPVVAPRLREFGEAVDDHQVSFARRLAELGLLRLVEDLAQLEGAVSTTIDGVRTQRESSQLAVELHDYLSSAVASQRRRS
jgi:UDP-N-acetylglucosamine transferase subunit ALG13